MKQKLTLLILALFTTVAMVFTVEVIFVVIIGSIGNGTLTLTGEATGAKDFKLYRNIVKTSIKWSFLVAAFA
ncbi:MAG: hypothetical protein IKM68_04195, partial [Bacteroidaceae bacterium]|nr:hypothetical protein [Bacteroidaceae bacterium]